MNQDAWGKLWDKVTGEPGAPPTIEVDPELYDRVTLVWPDGSRSGLLWHDGDWRHVGTADTSPCDVAARDAF